MTTCQEKEKQLLRTSAPDAEITKQTFFFFHVRIYSENILGYFWTESFASWHFLPTVGISQLDFAFPEPLAHVRRGKLWNGEDVDALITLGLAHKIWAVTLGLSRRCFPVKVPVKPTPFHSPRPFPLMEGVFGF